MLHDPLGVHPNLRENAWSFPRQVDGLQPSVFLGEATSYNTGFPANVLIKVSLTDSAPGQKALNLALYVEIAVAIVLSNWDRLTHALIRKMKSTPDPGYF